MGIEQKIRRRDSRVGEGHLFFASAAPRVFAHRGLHLDVPENTMAAFEAAIDAGATHLETDVRGTADGDGVLFHDKTLGRVAGSARTVASYTARELAVMDLGSGEGVPTLELLLDTFPGVSVNIDIKDEAALDPAVSAIRNARAERRVLVTSFSARRQRAIANALPEAATSPGWDRVLAAVLAARNGAQPLVNAALRDVDAVQFPPRSHGIGFLSSRVIDSFLATGCELHVWTINSPGLAERLFRRGVHGVFTDRADLLVPVAKRLGITHD